MIGSTIVNLDIVDSTNNYAAKELLTKSLNEGTVFVAACQQSGRGQGSSAWESESGLNLTFSIILYPRRLALANQFLLSKAIALGVADFLSDLTSNVSVKWPNDIYAGDKKIAGILIETAVSAGKFSHAIIGIGLNVNQETFVSDAPNPVSLKNLTGEHYDLQEVLSQLCQKLDRRYLQLIGRDTGTINVDYEKHLYRRMVWAKFERDSTIFDGMITGVDSDGCLLITDRDGKTTGFQFKEVAFVR